MEDGQYRQKIRKNIGGCKVNFWIKSIVRFILTILFITIISFVLVKISPIDPAEAYARRVFITSDEKIEQLREDMGLNKSVGEQYLRWWQKVLKGDFGKSLITSKNVFDEVINALRYTSNIVLLAIIIQALGATIFAIVAYLNNNNLIGKVMNKIYIIAISIPPFIVASIVLEILAIRFGIIDISNNDGIARFLPAAISLSVNGIAYFGKLLYDSIEKEMNQDAVFYLKTLGFSEKKIIEKYILYTSIWSVLPTFMQMMGMCFAGTMVVEQAFGLPGMGSLLINSVLLRDVPMIHGIILCLGIVMAIFLIFADIVRKGDTRSEIQH